MAHGYECQNYIYIFYVTRKLIISYDYMASCKVLLKVFIIDIYYMSLYLKSSILDSQTSVQSDIKNCTQKVAVWTNKFELEFEIGLHMRV